MQPDEVAISCLTHAIEDTQDTIRAYDIKSEIIAVILTLSIGVTNYSNFDHCSGWPKWILLISWLMTLATILMLGLVLYPKKIPFKNISLGSYSPQGTYFMSNLAATPQNTVSNLSDKAIKTDWVSELMYENMKLSSIRDRKHFWFQWTLKSAGLTIILILVFAITNFKP